MRNATRARLDGLAVIFDDRPILNLLSQLAPFAKPVAIEKANLLVGNAISRYRVCMTEDGGKLKSVTSLAETRKSLRNLHESLTVCRDSFQAPRISIAAYMAFTDEHGPVRSLVEELDAAIESVTAVRSKFSKKADNPPNELAEILASRIVAVLKVLDLDISMTRDDRLQPTNRAARANYARLLRLALKIAGERPAANLSALMKKGLQRSLDQDKTQTVQSPPANSR